MSDDDRREADRLRQTLALAHSQRDRWRSAFLVEATVSESGRALAKAVAAIVNRAHVGSQNTVAQTLLGDLTEAVETYTERVRKAPGLPAALELLDDTTHAVLELAGLKALLECLRDAVEVQVEMDRAVREAGLELDVKTQRVWVPTDFLRALVPVLGVDTQAVNTVDSGQASPPVPPAG
jgi:hypothetical protein